MKALHFVFVFVFVLVTSFSACKKSPFRSEPDFVMRVPILGCKGQTQTPTHLVQLRGRFSTHAKTIVPREEKPESIEIDSKLIKALRMQQGAIFCRVLARQGIYPSSSYKNESTLPLLVFELGPGLRIAHDRLDFDIPPTQNEAELMTNVEHSINRLLEEKKNLTK